MAAWVAPAITAAGSILGGMAGGKGSSGNQYVPMPTSTTTYGNLAPHPATHPLWGWLAGNTNELMQQPQQYYPGQGYISPSDLTKWGVGNLEAAGLQINAAQPYAKWGIGQQVDQYGAGVGNYNFLSNAANIGKNPYVQDMLDANARTTTQALNEQWLPAVNSGAAQVNALGGSRQGIAQGQAVERASEQLSRANADMMLNAYGQGLGAQQTALGQTTNMMGAAGMPYGLASSVAGNTAQAADWFGRGGQTIENYQNTALQDQMNRWNFSQNEPWTRMNNVMGVTQGMNPLGVNQGGGNMIGMTENPGYVSPFTGAMGGAGLGGYLGQMLGGKGSQGNNYKWPSYMPSNNLF